MVLLNTNGGWTTEEEKSGKRPDEMTSWNAFFWEFARGNESAEKNWNWKRRIIICYVMNV